MNKQVRVVIVDDNSAVTNEFKRYFSKSELVNVVGVFKDGKEALEYILSKPDSYDFLVLDLVLPSYDGIKILEEMQANNLEKKIVVLSSFKDNYSIRKIQMLGANYFMLKPIEPEVLEARILDLINQKDELTLARFGNLELEVSTLLHDLGIPSHVRGYKYIREGVLILYESEGLVTLVTKEIYPKIATKYDTTPSRVERAIRHAIELSWARGDIKLMDEIFGNSVDIERSKPTNAEFITAIADRFKIFRRETVK